MTGWFSKPGLTAVFKDVVGSPVAMVRDIYREGLRNGDTPGVAALTAAGSLVLPVFCGALVGGVTCAECNAGTAVFSGLAAFSAVQGYLDLIIYNSGSEARCTIFPAMTAFREQQKFGTPAPQL